MKTPTLCQNMKFSLIFDLSSRKNTQQLVIESQTLTNYEINLVLIYKSIYSNNVNQLFVYWIYLLFLASINSYIDIQLIIGNWLSFWYTQSIDITLIFFTLKLTIVQTKFCKNDRIENLVSKKEEKINISRDTRMLLGTLNIN